MTEEKSSEVNKKNILLDRCVGCDAECIDFDCYKLGEPRKGVDEIEFPR